MLDARRRAYLRAQMPGSIRIAPLRKSQGGRYVRKVPTGRFTPTGKPIFRYIYRDAQGREQDVPEAGEPRTRMLTSLAQRHGRRWLERHPELPEFTDKHYKRPDGTYHPDRAKLHEAIVDKLHGEAKSVPKGEQLHAIVTMGGPASGKTTGLQHLFGGETLKRHVNVNPDEAKVHLPEYKHAVEIGLGSDGKPVSARNAAHMVHDESSDIADRAHHRAIAERKHIILDGTGKNPEKYEEKLKQLKAHGYQVHLVMADIDRDIAYARKEERAVKGGRHVPDEIFHEAHDRVPPNFMRLAKHADKATLVSNDEFPPTKVWTKGADGSTQVHDSVKFREFQARASNGRKQHG